MTNHTRTLSRTQKGVLIAAFVPMLATGVAGGIGTYSNISHAYGKGTAMGAVAAGEGATAVLGLVLLGLTMLGQSSPSVIRLGLWALPAAASVMAAMAADEPGSTVIYAVTPMGMCVAAEGMAFLARRIVVHLDGRDADAERKTAAVVQALAYHRARAANHPDKGVRKRSDRASWRLARKVGVGDVALGGRLVEVQRDRLTAGAGAALADMFNVPADPTGRAGDAPSVELSRPHTEMRESSEIMMDRSTRELEGSTSAPVTPVEAPVEGSESTPQPAAGVESGKSLRSAAAVSTRRRGATGRLPKSARSARPNRTPEELLNEAREATAGWSDAELNAEAIRKAVRTSVAKARGLRDTLRAEREATA
jgi:hypothetical protein